MSSGKRDVLAVLRARGFELKATLKGVAAYEGPLKFRGGSVAVRLEVVDWDFVAAPVIRLLERPEALKGYRPHLGLGSQVCYLDRESVYMDPYDPAAVIGRCLDEAELTLEEIAGGKHRLDLHDEFVAQWRVAPSVPLMIWDESTAAKRMLACVPVDFPHYPGTFVVTDDALRTVQALQKAGVRVGIAEHEAVVEFNTDQAPAIDPEIWPPSQLSDVLAWMKAWDPVRERSFRGRLESQWALERNHFIALFRTPSGRFGFDFQVDFSTTEAAFFAKRPAERRQHIITKKNPEISRFEVSDLSPLQVHGRNTTGRQTLFEKRIVLIGAGTIGGYLATYLARLGAGYGGGSLTVYDSQALGPENIGRNALSFRDLYRNKAQAVIDLVGGEFPYLRIVAKPTDARLDPELLDADLVIDATGSSAFSSWLNRAQLGLMKNEKPFPAIVYSWVEGPGDAARALFVDSPKFMCFDCLLLRHHDRPPEDRFPVSTRDPALGRERPGGCATYMPFAVSAAVSAAALCVDAIRDWVRGDPHPRLRSRRLDLQNTRSRDDTSPKPLPTCPACEQ